jgi:hypothetical protein
MRLSRRAFLVLGGAAGAAALGGAYLWYFGNPAKFVVAILQRYVGYLRVDRGSFLVFAEEYVKFKPNYEHAFAEAEIADELLEVTNPYKWFGQGTPFRRLDDNIVSRYLLSTDFFQNGADETRAVRYVAFYDPYVTPCRNPFVSQP